jgi:acetylornithine deacetylase
MTPLAAVTDLLAQLVACPSVNPKSAANFAPPFGEAGMVALLEKLLRGWGAKITITDVHPGRPNLLAQFPGKNPHRSILFDAHTDTVAVDGMIIPPFTPTVRDGKLYGRGACDTKGPMTAMLLAIRRILDEAGQPPATVWFAATCNEESGGTGAAALAKSGFRPDFAIAAEPTDLKIVHMHKGCLRVDIETRGVACHSSMPERGVNAIYKMCRVIDRLEREVIPALAKVHHPQLGSPTLSVGLIHGGSQVNIVPESCRIQVDRRVIPGENQDDIVRQLAGAETCEVTEFYPALAEPADSPASQHVAAACRRVLGHADFVVAPYATNAGLYHAAGIPSVVIGPGSLAQAHTKDEFIELDEVVRAVDLFAEILRTL